MVAILEKVTTYFKIKIIRLKGKKLRELKEACIERDRVCQNPYCKSGVLLEVHHVKFRSAMGEDKPENLILICRQCHDLIHSRGKLKITGIYPNWFFEQL